MTRCVYIHVNSNAASMRHTVIFSFLLTKLACLD